MLSGTVTFAPGELSKTITVATVGDNIDETNETVTVTLTNPQGASPEATPTLGDAVATGTILDNDQSVISIADTSVTEGGNLVFTVSRTLDSEQSQTVNYAVSLGSAELGDLSGVLSGTVTFAPGELSKTITVATVGDNIDETNETVTVTLTNPQGASPEATPTLGDAVSTGTILDNDQSGDLDCRHLGDRGRQPGVHGFPHARTPSRARPSTTRSASARPNSATSAARSPGPSPSRPASCRRPSRLPPSATTSARPTRP